MTEGNQRNWQMKDGKIRQNTQNGAHLLWAVIIKPEKAPTVNEKKSEWNINRETKPDRNVNSKKSDSGSCRELGPSEAQATFAALK